MVNNIVISVSLQETIVAFEVNFPLDTLGVDFKSDNINNNNILCHMTFIIQPVKSNQFSPGVALHRFSYI